MKKIKLSQGKYAIVDNDDFEWLNQWKWHYGGRGYAVRTVDRNKKVYMHRQILNPAEGLETDHKNMNRLDNRRKNLRACTVSQNQLNAKPTSRNTSGYRGVYWNNQANKWSVYIRVDNKNKFMGYYEDKVDAARRYNEVIKDYYGEFARENVI